MSNSGSHKKVANGLVALSSAAVFAVYSAGYLRTKSAADRFDQQAALRRPANPGRPPAVTAHPAVPPVAANIAAPAAPSRAPRAPRTAAREIRRRFADRTDRRKSVRRSPEAATETLPVQPSTPLPVAAAPLAAQAPSAAPEPPAVPRAAAAAPAMPQYKDGTYYGWGTSRHGDIQAAVVIQDGRILSASIAQCLTRYSCSVIAKLPPQVSERQSPETDYVSGATQSTNAFYYAVVEALSKAK